MHFCIKCDNMYYTKLDPDNTNRLLNYCRNCGYVDELTASEGMCVLNTQLKKGEQKFSHIINPYTKMDPTLPRVYNVKCPSEECPSNKNEEKRKFPEVIYMRYDDKNLKYVYICTECDTIWKTDDAK